MLKKLSIGTVLVASAVSSVAWGSGFYAGIGVGPEADNFKQSAHVIHVPDTNVKDVEHFSALGPYGTLFGGYAWTCSRFYLAGEANYNRNSGAMNASNSEFVHQAFSNTTYKIPYSYGLSVLPGYLITPMTVFYGRLGYANGHFETSTSDDSLLSVSRNLSGVRFGFGVMQALGCKLSARLEYSQINYNSTSFTAVPPGTVKTTKITPTSSLFEFGLVYKFC